MKLAKASSASGLIAAQEWPGICWAHSGVLLTTAIDVRPLAAKALLSFSKSATRDHSRAPGVGSISDHRKPPWRTQVVRAATARSAVAPTAPVPIVTPKTEVAE